MSARRKRVISTDEIQFNYKPAVYVIDRKKKGVSQNGQTPNIIGICSYCVLDRPVFEWNQVLLHPKLTPWWSFFFADGAHHKKPHSPTHPWIIGVDINVAENITTITWLINSNPRYAPPLVNSFNCMYEICLYPGLIWGYAYDLTFKCVTQF